MKHVILGVGAAGITAAKTIRTLRSDDEIVMISTDESVHSRCMLHKFIGNTRSVAELSFVPDGFFANNNIRHCGGVSVSGIDPEQKVVHFGSETESYDRLLIATGASGTIPPISGLQGAKHVYTLSSLSDAKAIRTQAAKTDHIVIIGAGLVGLDAAYGLMEVGKMPVVVEMKDSILSSNLDARAAATYQAEFEKAGCLFRLGSKVSNVICDASGAVTAIQLDNAEQLPCELLILATGVRPNIGFLENSGIAHERGVTVDEYLATNVPYVFAAGDVTGLSQNWPSATEQGEIAAYNMCGVQTASDNIFLLQNTVNFFGIPSLSVGVIAPAESDEVYCLESHNKYQKVIIRNGVPLGVILQGDISRSGFWLYLIKNKVNISGISKPIWKISFADAYSLEANGEYKWDVSSA